MLDTLNCLNQKSIALLEEHQLLEPLLRAEIVKSELSKILLDQEEEKKEIDESIKQMGITNEEDLKKWLSNNKMDKNELSRVIIKKLRIKLYCEKKFSNKVDSRFLDRKSSLDIIIYSIIKVKDPFKARELYLRLINNEDNFGNLAEKYSEGLESKTKGLVGPIELSKPHPALSGILKSSKPGIINPPIEIQGFWLVTRLESYDSAQLDDFMREKMGKELFNDYLETKTNELSESFRNQSFS